MAVLVAVATAASLAGAAPHWSMAPSATPNVSLPAAGLRLLGGATRHSVVLAPSHQLCCTTAVPPCARAPECMGTYNHAPLVTAVAAPSPGAVLLVAWHNCPFDEDSPGGRALYVAERQRGSEAERQRGEARYEDIGRRRFQLTPVYSWCFCSVDGPKPAAPMLTPGTTIVCAKLGRRAKPPRSPSFDPSSSNDHGPSSEIVSTSGVSSPSTVVAAPTSRSNRKRRRCMLGSSSTRERAGSAPRALVPPRQPVPGGCDAPADPARGCTRLQCVHPH